MQLELPHANTVTTIAEKIQTLQQADPFFQLKIFILEVLIALLEIANQMLLPSGFIFYL